jgi:hypothetical protein
MENRKFKTGTIRTFDRKTAEETRQVEFVISDETRDRHGTVVPIDAWKLKNFNGNGIVGYQHDVYGDSFLTKADPDDVIGIGEAFVEDGKLIGRVTFEPKEINEKAEKIFQKVLHGTLKATSVGFIETKKGKYGEKDEARDGENPTYYFGEVELLEFSVVNIPSNPAALRRKLADENTASDLEETRQQLATAQLENSQLTARSSQLETQVVTLKQNLKIEKMKRPSKVKLNN